MSKIAKKESTHARVGLGEWEGALRQKKVDMEVFDSYNVDSIILQSQYKDFMLVQTLSKFKQRKTFKNFNYIFFTIHCDEASTQPQPKYTFFTDISLFLE